MKQFYRLTKKGPELFVRLTPNAPKPKITGFYEEGKEHCALKVSVASIPEGGKANDALILLLSKTLRFPKTHIHLVSGHTSRNKILLLDGGTEALIQALIPENKERIK